MCTVGLFEKHLAHIKLKHFNVCACMHAFMCVHGWGAPTGRERELKLETFILQERDKERDRNRDKERLLLVKLRMGFCFKV